MQKAVSNLSDTLAREVLRYTLDVQRAGVTVSKQTVMELVRLDNALIGYIQTHNPNKKLVELHNKARATIQEHITRAEAQALSDYERVIAASAQQATNTLNTVIGAPIAAAYSEPAIIEAVSSAANVMGAPAASWWNGQAANTFKKFAAITRNGFMTGKDVDAMTREWQGASKQLRGQAETQVRTSVMSMANAAREQIYQKNKHIVKGVQAVATLDLRTSALCRARDGMQWYFDGSGKVPTLHAPERLRRLPPEPGTAPIKDGNVRLYHQTSAENLAVIEQEGLRFDRARGIEGPRAIYATEKPFYGDAEGRPTLEFQVPKDKYSDPFVLMDAVPPEAIIAAHYPWHRQARRLIESPDMLAKTLAGEYDDLLDEPEYGDAVRFVKENYGAAPTLNAPRNPNLKTLYHGTTKDSSKKILAEGFDVTGQLGVHTGTVGQATNRFWSTGMMPEYKKDWKLLPPLDVVIDPSKTVRMRDNMGWHPNDVMRDLHKNNYAYWDKGVAAKVRKIMNADDGRYLNLKAADANDVIREHLLSKGINTIVYENQTEYSRTREQQTKIGKLQDEADGLLNGKDNLQYNVNAAEVRAALAGDSLTAAQRKRLNQILPQLEEAEKIPMKEDSYILLDPNKQLQKAPTLEAPRNRKPEPYPGPPPWHWNCRSTLIGILKSYDEATGEWKQLMGPQKRASMDGQVAGDLTYDDWFKGLTEEQQKDVLGPAKHRLWKDGKLSMRDMVDQNGNALTVAQLENRYAKKSDFYGMEITDPDNINHTLQAATKATGNEWFYAHDMRTGAPIIPMSEGEREVFQITSGDAQFLQGLPQGTAKVSHSHPYGGAPLSSADLSVSSWLGQAVEAVDTEGGVYRALVPRSADPYKIANMHTNVLIKLDDNVLNTAKYRTVDLEMFKHHIATQALDDAGHLRYGYELPKSLLSIEKELGEERLTELRELARGFVP